jgi:hypothetical protein
MTDRLLQRNPSVCRADLVTVARANAMLHGTSRVNRSCAQLDSSWRPE